MSRDLKDTAIYVAYEEFEPRDTAVAEKDLLRAVLLTAMNDLQRNGDQSKKAREYFLSPENSHLFSFRSVCNLLDIDRTQVLRIVGLWDESAQSSDPAPPLDKSLTPHQAQAGMPNLNQKK